MRRLITIDGPAASGKSTTAAAVAERLAWLHLDSGAVYRAVTLAALDQLAPGEWSGARVRDLAHRLPVRLVQADGGFRTEIAGVDVSGPIRSPRVTADVSAIASLPAVREWATEEIRAAVQGLGDQGVVVEGRDIGTVVFPDAPLKVFLTAGAGERARRRLLQDGQSLEPERVVTEAARLEARDERDRRRATAPLVPARDAVLLDTTDLSFDAAVEQIVALARRVFR